MKMTKKGFTLVEMLIVIVIIGILAAAILPSLMGAREKANDTAKRAALSNVIAPLISYAGDKGVFPDGCGNLESVLTGSFKAKYSDKIPTDSSNGNVSTIINGATAGSYGYCSLKKGNIEGSAFMLIAQVSDSDKGNYNGTTTINKNSDADTVIEALGATGQYYVIVKS